MVASILKYLINIKFKANKITNRSRSNRLNPNLTFLPPHQICLPSNSTLIQSRPFHLNHKSNNNQFQQIRIKKVKRMTRNTRILPCPKRPRFNP